MASGRIRHKEEAETDDGEDFGPSFAKKDVIGCGILLDRKEVFFTKNGAFIGTAFKDVSFSSKEIFPAVTIQSMSHHIEANFGTSKFVFDLDGYRMRESLESFFDICSIEFDRAKLHSLVKSYLVHYSYVETL
jgi:hypothetical protein